MGKRVLHHFVWLNVWFDLHLNLPKDDFLIENPRVAISMGENGKKSIMKKYNWSSQEKKLLKLYEKLLTWIVWKKTKWKFLLL